MKEEIAMSKIKFEIGDRVWSEADKRWGKIADAPQMFPFVMVHLDNEDVYCARFPGLLFFEEIHIPESARTRPTPKYTFTPGEPVCVRSSHSGTWYLRAFTSQRADGKFICRASSCPTDTGVWTECEPYDRTLLGFDAATERFLLSRRKTNES